MRRRREYRFLSPFWGVFGWVVKAVEQKIALFFCVRVPALFCLYIYMRVCVVRVVVVVVLLAREKTIKPGHSFDIAPLSAGKPLGDDVAEFV